jgi:hypothetical protein
MQHWEFAMARWPAFLPWIPAALLSGLPAQAQAPAQTNYEPPFATVATEEFGQGGALTVATGAWVASGGTYNSTSASTSPAMATISQYTPELVGAPPDPFILSPHVWFRARMRNESGAGNTSVGIVYRWQNRSNFHEASFSPTGSVVLRTVVKGVATTVATGTYSGGGQGKWFDAEVSWTQGEAIVSVNGFPVLRAPEPADLLASGRVGLITRRTTAKFDRLRAVMQFGDPDFREGFSAGEPPDWVQIIYTNPWNVANGVYYSPLEMSSARLILLNVGVGVRAGADKFQLRARMLNPYGGSGNRMGILYNWNSGDELAWNEVVFGADGIARANKVFWQPPINQVPITVLPLATAPYPGRRGQWFDVDFRADAVTGRIDVSVDGTPVFDGLLGAITGPFGLVTHWVPGRFDDVWFNHEVFAPQRETFTVPGNPTSWFAVRGTWDTTDGTLNTRAAGLNDLARMRTWHRSTGYKFSARMLNLYSGSGNRIGLVFGYDPYDGLNGDYYEVVFAPTGEAYLNKVIQGVSTQVAKASHGALGRNVWFTVDLIRDGPFATVNVNGQPVFQKVRAAQLDTPSNAVGLGVTSRFARARFDDLRFEEYPPR